MEQRSHTALINDAVEAVTGIDDMPRFLGESAHIGLVQRVSTYEKWVREHGIYAALIPGQNPESVHYACADFALSRVYQGWLSNVSESWPYHNLCLALGNKQEAWNEASRPNDIQRSKRTVQMKLHPVYYSLIASERKKIEGRAYNPSSDKQYPFIFPGDEVEFALDPESPEFLTECDRYGLSPSNSMRTKILGVSFAPLVQLSFHDLEPSAGELFQPDPEYFFPDPISKAIYSAARYYAIPGYPDLIARHGFIGISLDNPRQNPDQKAADVLQ